MPFAHQRGQRLPDNTLEQLQSMRNQLLCSPDDVARAALFAVTQPIHVNIAELTVRPPIAGSFTFYSSEQMS
jgi:NADP-dependent 3-hydroxy acid dehydrogenase YdfG